MSPLRRQRRGHVLALLVVLLAAASRGDPAIDTFACQREPFTCGNLSVRYPFHLSNGTDEAPTTGYGEPRSYCGYPGLAIHCDDDGDKPTLRLGRDDYAVSDINYASLTVSLADADVVGDSSSSCPTVRHNVTVPSPFHLPTSDLAYLLFFTGCSFDADAAELARKPPGIKPITCGSTAEATMSFVLPEDRVPPKEWWRACQSVYSAPVLKDALRVDAQSAAWREGGYAKALRDGFQVGWDRIGSGPCGRCEQSGGRCGYNGTGGFLGCLCADGALAAGDDGCGEISGSAAPLSGHGYTKTRIKTYAIAGSSSVIMLCLLLFALWLGYKKYGCKRNTKETARIESFLQKNGTLHPKRYTYAQVKRMTRSFAEKLGQGGFGAVYRGSFSDGRQIAVKMLKDYKTDGEDFINEVASISRTSHVNVVTFIGFSLEGSKRALIYDYMSNGSLEKYAFKDNSEGGNILGWKKLFDIAVGIARGLEYLHRGCNTRIVHFDIKPHNILLDQNFCPKISDFGLAKLCVNKESVLSIGCARGTIGYIAPEVFSKQFGEVSSKSDVYSYGMMVLEMVGAREKNISQNSESSSQYFPQWIYEHLDDYCVSASEINGEITEIVRKMIVVGLWCIQVSATNRPTMTGVVEMLEGSTSVLELPLKVLLS